MKVPANRAVAILTPAVFAPAAGAISVFAAKKAGMEIDENQITAIFIAGATIAFGKASLWLKGWQDFEKNQSTMPADAFTAADDVEALDVSGVLPDDEDDDDVAFAGTEPELEVDDDDEFDEPDFDEEEPALDDEPVDGHLVLNGVSR